jgi:zinc protease
MDDFVGTMRRRLADLSVDDVNRAIKKHLSYDALHIVYIAKDANGLKEGLTSGGPSPIAYTSDKPSEILQEDKRIERYPLGIAPGQVRIVDVAEVFEER